MHKILSLFLAILMLSSIIILTTACGEQKTLHCDNCGREVKVSASSNMTDDWILYCTDCEKELGLDTIVTIAE